MKRRVRVKPKNPKRASREFVRTYGSKERVAFVQALPCVVPFCYHTPCENAHVGPKGKGTGAKADADQIAPLCSVHHAYLHQHGPLTFAATFGVSRLMLLQAAETTEIAWRAQCGEFAE